MEELTLQELHAAAKDMNTIVDFESPFTTNKEGLIKQIKDNAEHLLKEDELQSETKVVLQKLKVGPWYIEELSKTDEEKKENLPMSPIPQEVKPASEKTSKKQTTATPKPKKEPAKLSRYGHRVGSMAGAMDEMFWKGIDIEEAVKTLEEQFKKPADKIRNRFISHYRYLKATKNVPVNVKDTFYKATKAQAEVF